MKLGATGNKKKKLSGDMCTILLSKEKKKKRESERG